MVKDAFVEKIKMAADRIKNDEPLGDIINWDDVIEMIMSLNTIMTTSFHHELQPYIDEGLIDPLTCRYIKDYIVIPPVGSIVELDQNAKMFSVCGVDWVEGVDGGVVLIKGRTKWLELIGG